MASLRSSRVSSALRPYQVVAVCTLTAIVVLGSTLASLRGSTSFNLFFSDPLRFPHAADAAQPSTLFADRRNFLNALFVKRVWAWTTLAFGAQAVVLRRPWSKLLQRASGEGQPGANDPLVRSILRFIIATVAWVFCTSWFLGPSLVDRTFMLTGGHCRLDVAGTSIRVPAELCRTRAAISYETHPQLFQVEGFNTADFDTSSLKDLLPRLRGGVDMSGHTFLLVLVILFMLEEITPFLPYLFLRLPAAIRPSKALIESLIPRSLWASLDPFHPAPTSSSAPNGRNGSGSRPTSSTSVKDNLLASLSRPHIQAQLTAGGVLMHIGLSLWMLLMTQLYFHTLAEKIAGLVIGVLSWYALPKDEAPSRPPASANKAR
ncbi:unnamed protein product [Tilletia controversa]|uniref:Uncharacterized protein n=3 Tax=Tilletia TaxID=13289 RepID=A0A8X7SXR9_9BASI|nr:hypothetical protein CF336_g2783 [Tilletia laevis]KAE8201651.1 hypothetical protein CF328_g2621 [Tilletia controversa]KAE8263858.1 hypothetical protein A4X03_0g1374 [Tilletia caries]KAE8206350.1 hypothetical protein CF335_g1958 [Tilletia laevis]KAE8249356.1 hypothetical protein A4X06_0g3266 [Tilletia controversa]